MIPELPIPDLTPDRPVSAVQRSAFPQAPFGYRLLDLWDQARGHVKPKMVAVLIGGWFAFLAITNAMIGAYVGKSMSSQAGFAPAGTSLINKLSPDDERRANIDSIDNRLKQYYAAFGTYPSSSQINSFAFRTGDPSFKVLNHKTYIDPNGGSGELMATPIKGAYYYTSAPTNCDSSRIHCAGYTIGATLTSGELYSHTNLN